MRLRRDAKRTFRTAWFTKAARKARIDDVELCAAIREVVLGQAIDLGGGVFKKRLNRNLHRSIVLAKGGSSWIYVYLFAKKNLSNIEYDELDGFRRLAKSYESLTDRQIVQMTTNGELTEICHDR